MEKQKLNYDFVLRHLWIQHSCYWARHDGVWESGDNSST